MYPLLTLDDATEIVYSIIKDGNKVKIYIEKPDAKDCFHNAVCWLPEYKWENINGFDPNEIAMYHKIIQSTESIIMEKLKCQ